MRCQARRHFEAGQRCVLPCEGIEGEDWKSVPHRTAELFRGKRVDDGKWFALIGRADKQHPWVIKDGETVTAPASGVLFCYFNDVQFEKFYENNKGFVVLEVEEVPELDPCAIPSRRAVKRRGRVTLFGPSVGTLPATLRCRAPELRQRARRFFAVRFFAGGGRVAPVPPVSSG